MRMIEPPPDLIAAAIAGDMASLDAVLVAVQPGVFNLAVRMLGNRDDAADSTQEILLKVVTHLASFRREAAFTTWVWSIAKHHLLTARTKTRESPEVSLEAMGERLEAGLMRADHLAASASPAHSRIITPEEKLEARQIAVSCTQSMLMTLDRDHRLAYMLDTVFDLSSKEAAAVIGISAEAYRQRLSRAKARIEPFMRQRCGLVSDAASCSCRKQLGALKSFSPDAGASPPAGLKLRPVELEEAERAFASYTRLGDAAEVFKRSPELAAPERLRAAIHAVLTQEEFMSRGLPQ